MQMFCCSNTLSDNYIPSEASVSLMASTYRDRTSEFRSLCDILKKIAGRTAVDRAENVPLLSNTLSPVSSRSEFNKKASRIGLEIHETSLKIARLVQLAKRSSMFEDPIVEIQELTALVRNDITALNVALTDLQTIQNMEIADGIYSEDEVGHSTAVCDDLKGRLMGPTKQLQDVLTTITENIKAHENKEEIFSTNAARETRTEPSSWSSSSNAPGSSQPPALPSSGAQVGNQLRRRLAVYSSPSQQMEMSMLQQVVPRQKNYTQSKAVALHNVKSTISKVGGIFMHLATTVAQRGELAIRRGLLGAAKRGSKKRESWPREKKRGRGAAAKTYYCWPTLAATKTCCCWPTLAAAKTAKKRCRRPTLAAAKTCCCLLAAAVVCCCCCAGVVLDFVVPCCCCCKCMLVVK